MQIVIAIYNGHICTQYSTLNSSGMYKCDGSMVICFENTIPKHRICNMIVKEAEMEESMTVEDLDLYFHLQWTYLYSMK